MNSDEIPPAFFAGVAFENRSLVPIAIQQRVDPAELLYEQVLEAADKQIALGAIDAAFDAAGDERAAEALRRIAQKLGDTAAGIALRRVIVGAEAQTLRAAAASARISHVALLKAERRVRKKLGLPRPP